MKENQPEVKHEWKEEEKRVNCSICLLASNMKDCRKCPFYIPKVNTMSK